MIREVNRSYELGPRGMCKAHKSSIKMQFMRHSFYWPTILQDCIKYSKGCKAY